MNKSSIRVLLSVIGLALLLVFIVRSRTLPYFVAGLFQSGRQSAAVSSAPSLTALPYSPEIPSITPSLEASSTPQATSLPAEGFDRSQIKDMSQAELATAHVPCEKPEGENSMRLACAAMKKRLNELRETAYPLTVEAFRALPSRTRSIPLGTPVPRGTIPEKYMLIEEVKDRDPGHPTMNYATSIWRLGAVLDKRGLFYQLFLVASPLDRNGLPSLRTVSLDGSEEVQQNWIRVWDCPEPIGTIKITGITSQTGIVSFTSSSGKSGTLDMSSGIWSFTP
jgi:hypothetical protein